MQRELLSSSICLCRAATEASLVKLFLCGDVMAQNFVVNLRYFHQLGRGIDQILPHPSPPLIYERCVQSAIDYVQLAEKVNGQIPRKVDYDYIWGEALEEFRKEKPDVRIINLETSITKSENYDPKGINYRMNPHNCKVLTTARIDVAELANNHVLDWGIEGLVETLATLKKLNIKPAGAGHNIHEAWSPAILKPNSRSRVLLYAFGSCTAGIPEFWSATVSSPGIAYLKDLSEETIHTITDEIGRVHQPNDIVVLSIHYGANWGHDIQQSLRDFSHQLIDRANISVIQCHSSHHFKGVEIYNKRLILYGCGDFVNDYEGIRGYEAYRDDLVLMYFVTLDPSNQQVCSFTVTPLQLRHFQLQRPSIIDIEWIRNTLERYSFNVKVEMQSDGKLIITDGCWTENQLVICSEKSISNL